MKRFLALCFTALCLLLSGCASVIHSDVTAFNEWPAGQTDKSYTFSHTAEQNNDLEYRSYENLVGVQLQRLGFTPAPTNAALSVSLTYGLSVREVRLIEPVLIDPGFYGSPFYGQGWGYRGFYGPFNDPFWYNPPVVTQREENFQVFTRHLHVTIARSVDAKNLYDVNVVSEGRISALPLVMPYLVRSAFSDFPGTSGVTRQVNLKVEGNK